MSKGKYLTEVITFDDIQNSGNKICVLAGVGAGKNTWVHDELTKHGRVLLLTSRRAIVDDTKSRWTEDFDVFIDRSGGIKKNVVMTYAKLANLVKNAKLPEKFITEDVYFDFVVVDEAHATVSDSTFMKSTFYLWAFIQYVLKNRKTRVILMTGTIAPVKDLLIKDKWKILDFTNECINLKPKTVSIIPEYIAIFLMKQYAKPNKKVVYMASSAKDIASNIYPHLVELGFYSNRIVMVMASASEQKYLKKIPGAIEKSKTVLENITNGHSIPEYIDILLTTSKLREGVNFENNNIGMVFIDSHNEIDITQFTGRVREGIFGIFVVDKEYQNKSKTSSLEYNYASYECKSANEYLRKLISDNKLESGGLLDRLGVPEIDSFIKFIEDEKKYEYVAFNPFSGQFEIFELKNEGHKFNNLCLYRYGKNKSKYIDSIFNTVTFDLNFTKQHCVDNYLKRNGYLNVPLHPEKQKEIIDILSSLDILNDNDEKYGTLQPLVKRFGYTADYVGGNDYGYRIITKNQKSASPLINATSNDNDESQYEGDEMSEIDYSDDEVNERTFDDPFIY